MKCQFFTVSLCFLLGLSAAMASARAAEVDKTVCVELSDEVRSKSGFFQVVETHTCNQIESNNLSRGAKEVQTADSCLVIAEFSDGKQHLFFADRSNNIRAKRKVDNQLIEAFQVRAENIFAAEVDLVKFNQASLKATVSKEYWGLPWNKDYVHYTAQCQ